MGCLRSLRAHLRLDWVSWVQSGSVEIAVGIVAGRYGTAPSSAPSLGRRSARELGSISSSPEAARLCRYELGAVTQHRMPDNGEATGERARSSPYALSIVLAIAKAQSLSFS